MEKPFTNREITKAVENLSIAFDERLIALHEDIKKIDIKVGIQNGRVGKLEKWQSFIMGGLAIISVIILPILFIVTSKLFDQLTKEKTPTTASAIQQKAIELQGEATKLQTASELIK